MFSSTFPTRPLVNRGERQIDAAGSKALDEMLQYIAEVEGRVKCAVDDSARRMGKLKEEEQAERHILASLRQEILLAQERRKREAGDLDQYVRRAGEERGKLEAELSSLRSRMRCEREEAERVSMEARQVRQRCEEDVQTYQHEAQRLVHEIKQLNALKKNAEMDVLLVEQLLRESAAKVIALDGGSLLAGSGEPAKDNGAADALVSSKVTELTEELQEADSLAARYLACMQRQQREQRATLYKMEERALAKREELTALRAEADQMRRELALCAREREKWNHIHATLKEEAAQLQRERDALLLGVHDLAHERQAMLEGNEAMGREALSNVEQVIFQALQKSLRYREVFVELGDVKRSLQAAVRTLAEQKQGVERDFYETEQSLAAKRNILMAHHDILSAQDEKLASAIERSRNKESEVMRFVHDLDQQMKDAQALAMAEAIRTAQTAIPRHD